MVYNPFQTGNDLFYQYTAYKSEEPKESKDLIVGDDLFGEFKIPGAYSYNPATGNIIAPANTPEVKEYDWSEMNRLGETHGEPAQQNMSKMKYDLSGNKKHIADFFRSKVDDNGKQILSDFQIAGIVGNLTGESKLNPEAVNPTSKAYGIAQWLGSRKEKLFAKYGQNPNLDQQLEFLWDELKTTEKTAFNKLLQTTSLEEATNSFMKHFERPSQREMAQSISNRIKYGKELLSYGK